MIALLGLCMVTVFLYLVMSKRLSPMVSLIVVPAVFAVLGGFAPDLGDMITEGITDVAPTAAMLLFAIIYFGIMIDAGLFDPIARGVVRLTRNDPLRLIMGTVALVALVSLDGDGTTTFMITVSALLPIYRKLGVSPVLMTGLACMTNAVLNVVPWGGPAARAASALRLDPQELFVPMIPALAAGLVTVFAIAYALGLRERARLRTRTGAPVLAGAGGPSVTGGGDDIRGGSDETTRGGSADFDVLAPDRESLRPKLIWFNAGLTVVLLTALIIGVLPIAVLFMIGTGLALIVNYPRLEQQRARIASHADSVVAVVAMVFAAAVFTGVLSGTGMIEQMAQYLLVAMPDALFPFFSVIVAVLSVPLTFFMSNDAFYFGVMPILAEAGAQHGIGAMEIARASLLGQPIHMLSPLVPAMYVLIGLAKVDLGDHHRFAIKWALVVCAVVIASGLGIGIIAIH
ncbi:CitMHS family citrate-Mg2+:H+ or citrate-Ca2+:H+ symporter [Saccharopolyspora erythraea NRRL 2338]|uniref:Mg++ citrate complex transporter n=2 Tax=Saccharopolyspora erythraea TaxID=1836 RepID=A4FB62_SACEN|nr:citrate:proton symporter [Saccharopolyspora erythraea]EQD83965.1 citrate:proton symporter [Saccharopolyspora erythraea D]PFG95068.1 CitMHS family citrate-Mg2+:H+ or citrate-Ca2+:H+ symporter [Saccharopolyspora erythraea NRRL 2338]QRK91749.1 citrate transporter [Saccharopolyspora erythraea]CAM01287.1 Mg++ citrate complex transporter [Saccharopolyspora erythraea NRRL 2338]